MMKFTTIIPERYNDGKRVSPATMRRILNNLRDQFHGYTAEGRTDGCWLDPTDGKPYADAGMKVSVSCDRSRLAEAEAAVMAISRLLKQKAMYFEVQYADGVRILRCD
ncbi:MAG: hypothetical protein ACJ8F7_19875 [Gemmataceae bacterium]